MLEKYRRGQKKGFKSNPDRSYSNLLLVGAFGLALLLAKPDWLLNYNGILRAGCLAVFVLGAYRSMKTGG